MVTSFGKKIEDQTAASESASTDEHVISQLQDDGTYHTLSITDEILKQGRVVSKTADYTITAEDEIILVDCTAGVVTVTLPTAVGIKGSQKTIKKTDVSANAVTIDGNGSQTIDGSLTKTLAAQYNHITILSDGANWLVIASS